MADDWPRVLTRAAGAVSGSIDGGARYGLSAKAQVP